MEEGLQPYHVPQQSRREKLRFTPSGCAGLLPSLVPSDLLTYANTNPESSNLQIDPATFQTINNNPFLNFPSQSLQAEPLSLSLSSVHNTNTNNLPLERNLQRFTPSNDVVWRSSVGPLGPFTGYNSALKGSRFLKPAQQLLEELCDVGGRGIHAPETSSFLEPRPESLRSACSGNPPPGGDNGGEGGKKSRLLTMLDEVHKRYKQFYQHMQAIVTSLEYVSGLCNAAPYASLAIKAMSKHFKCLKNVITHQLQFMSKAHFHKIDGHGGRGGPYGQIRASHNPELLGHQPGWRPQRGLPERAVTVLRAWLFEHFLHPYPTDTDKLMLAKQTGLSRSQVANWFINARVRLWKPMVEEIHMLETRQPQKHPQTSEDDHNTNKSKFLQDHVPFNKRTRTYEPPPHDHTMPVSNQLPNTHNAMTNVGVTHGISLSLGLHQNNAGLAVSEPFLLNETHRFGLAASGSESQNLHDLVG